MAPGSFAMGVDVCAAVRARDGHSSHSKQHDPACTSVLPTSHSTEAGLSASEASPADYTDSLEPAPRSLTGPGLRSSANSPPPPPASDVPGRGLAPARAAWQALRKARHTVSAGHGRPYAWVYVCMCICIYVCIHGPYGKARHTVRALDGRRPPGHDRSSTATEALRRSWRAIKPGPSGSFGLRWEDEGQPVVAIHNVRPYITVELIRKVCPTLIQGLPGSRALPNRALQSPSRRPTRRASRAAQPALPSCRCRLRVGHDAHTHTHTCTAA
jgi:hypothetical protein